MYRIDEDTYIDNSLVTCAEYQLFIDEMHAKGKFYQPDHWTSYQFPAGQAREPVLGVRRADAEAFCRWLSQREVIWIYRLPTANDEAQQYPMKEKKERLCGYWTSNDSFIWAGTTPTNPRALNNDNGSVDGYPYDLASALNLDGRRDLNYARELAHELAQVDIPEYIHISNIASNFANTLDFIISYILDYRRENDLAINDFLARILNYDYLDLASIRHIASTLNRARNRDIFHKIDDFLTRSGSIWVDLFTLQERIMGRSPAFEGIRLVKIRAASQEHSA